MNGNCHFVFGASIGTAIAVNINKVTEILPELSYTSETQTLFILGGIVGGIFPDIDNPSSYMGKLTVPVSTWIGNISKIFGKSGKNHRGLLHDPIVYITGFVLAYLYCLAWCGFFVGCLSHLFLDMFNLSGVPFLFGIKHLHLGKIVSGSKESVIFTWIYTAVVFMIGILLKNNIF